ncbi:MAG: hypothetical protein ACKPEA_05875, partial [Planctomycetota bacterium]
NSTLALWVQAPGAVGNLQQDLNVSGAGVMNAASVSINPVAGGAFSTHSITKTAAIASGFSVSMEYASAYGSSSSFINLTQAFEVTAGSSVTITLTLNALNTLGGQVSLVRATSINSSEYPTAEYQQTILSQLGGMGSMQVDTKSSVTTLTLTEGRYMFNAYYGLDDNASHTGTLINFAVPAPGAAALLGLAGLVGRRRKA